MGDMIALPFFFWLLLVSFDFGNLDQIFAVLAIVGLVISIATRNSIRTPKNLLLDILCFGLLASPLVRRMTVVPLEKFNYLAFTIPTTIFVLFYLLSICFSVRQYQQLQKQALSWQNKTACNIGFGVIGAGRINPQLFIRYCALVPARRNKFGLWTNDQQYCNHWASIPADEHKIPQQRQALFVRRKLASTKVATFSFKFQFYKFVSAFWLDNCF